MSIWGLSAFLGVALLGACTAHQHEESESAAIRKRAAQEIERICALEGAEREAALKRFQQESGFELYCGER